MSSIAFNPITGEFDLIGLTDSGHQQLRQLCHLADSGGPFWVSGAYREMLPSGDPFPQLITWYVDSSKTTKIFAKLITYDANKQPTSIQWTAYAPDGVTVVAQAVDTITYTAVFETSRTRIVT